MENENYLESLDDNPDFLNWFKAGWGLKIAEKKFGKNLANEAESKLGRALLRIEDVPESLTEIAGFIESIESRIEAISTYNETVSLIKQLAKDSGCKISDEEIQADKQTAIENMMLDSDRAGLDK